MAINRVVLVGMMGAGKTSVGRALAGRLGWPYWDNDAELRRIAGADGPAVLASAGADRLHALEASVLVAALVAPPPLVVSAPGSVALDPALGARLAGEAVVWLRAEVATLAARVAAGPDRPFLGPAGSGSGSGSAGSGSGSGGSGSDGSVGSVGSGGSGGSVAVTLGRLDAERRPGFAALASVVVDVDGLAVAEVVDTVVAALGLG